MNSPSDDDLRQRLRELGLREAGGAPPLSRVIEGQPPTSRGVPAGSGRTGWLRGAVALAGACVVVLALVWWPTRPKSAMPVVAQAEPLADAALDWDLPSDSLLLDVADATDEKDVDRLAREIEGILKP